MVCLPDSFLPFVTPPLTWQTSDSFAPRPLNLEHQVISLNPVKLPTGI